MHGPKSKHTEKLERNVTNSSALAAAEFTARRQFGVFTTADALTAGVNRTMLNRHSRPGGRWRRIAPRVYEVVAQPTDWRRPLMAAQLWGGPDAALSHHAAAALLDLDGASRRHPPELYLPTSRQHPPWVVHRARLPPAEVVLTGGLRHTSPLRTLRDLADVLDEDTLELAVESVLRRGMSTESELTARASRRGRLYAVLARRPPGAPPAGSELETRFIQITRRPSIPPWRRQWPLIQDGLVLAYLDLCLPELGLFVELDGRWAHSKPTAIFVDRHRQNRIVRMLGWRPLRFTWDDVVRRPITTTRDVEDTVRRSASGAWSQLRAPG